MRLKKAKDYLLRDGKKISISELQFNTQQSVVSAFKNARKKKKITQMELSGITGIPQPNITRFESDKSNPTLEMMVKMAAALGKKLVINLEDFS